MARRIVIADEHPLLRSAVRAAVKRVWPQYDVFPSARWRKRL